MRRKKKQKKKLTMHFRPRQLKRYSFSCCVRSIEPTFVCRRCGWCPLIISDQFIKYALTLTRHTRSVKAHKQSLGHPWPASDPSHRLRLIPGLPRGYSADMRMLFCSAVRGPVDLQNTVEFGASGQRRNTEETFLGSPAVGEPWASSIQHGSAGTTPLSGMRGGVNMSQICPT